MLILRIQAGQRPFIVIKDKNNSLLIIKLYSGTMAGETVTGGLESSVDFNETFNFCVEADLFTTYSICCCTVFTFCDFSSKILSFCFLNFYICLKNPFPMKNND